METYTEITQGYTELNDGPVYIKASGSSHIFINHCDGGEIEVYPGATVIYGNGSVKIKECGGLIISDIEHKEHPELCYDLFLKDEIAFMNQIHNSKIENDHLSRVIVGFKDPIETINDKSIYRYKTLHGSVPADVYAFVGAITDSKIAGHILTFNAGRSLLETNGVLHCFEAKDIYAEDGSTIRVRDKYRFIKGKKYAIVIQDIDTIADEVEYGDHPYEYIKVINRCNDAVGKLKEWYGCFTPTKISRIKSKELPESILNELTETQKQELNKDAGGFRRYIHSMKRSLF